MNFITNLIARVLRKPVAATVIADPYTFRVAGITTYGEDSDGRYVKAEPGMRVTGFKRHYAHNAYSAYEHAATHARDYSRIGELYAVTDNEVIVAIFCDGCIVAGYAYRA
jgi:hypothetical protein